MAIVSMKDIIGYYNSVIKSFMDQGYVISPTTMNGGYSRVNGYTDLIKLNDKKTIMRIFVVHDYSSDCDCYYDIIKIIAKEYEWDGKFSSRNLWLDYGKSLSEKTFYQLKENRAYADTLEEFKQIKEIRRQRKVFRETPSTKKSYPINKLSADFIDRIMERINRLHGFKRATASCLEEVYSYIDCPYYNRSRFKGEVIFAFNNKRGRISLS